MRIAVFIAHPDYAALFIGGTIIKHARQGDDVAVVSMSVGEIGASFAQPDKSLDELAAIKTGEFEAMGRVQGVKSVRVLRFPDTKITNTPETRMVLVDVIRELRPDLVITHWPQAGHPDIREAAQAVIDACFFAYLPAIKTAHPAHQVRKLYAFGETASSDNFDPDFFIDVSDVIDVKIEAAGCFEGMVEEISVLFSKGDADPNAWTNIFLAANAHWGQESGVKYAEPYKELRIHGLGKRALQALPA
jgi:LmbE family N-acetylglucosaminyl deacetylase